MYVSYNFCMKNKWLKVSVMIVVGLIASIVGPQVEGITGSLTTIVGLILLIGGFVEFFKKKKTVPPTV